MFKSIEDAQLFYENQLIQKPKKDLTATLHVYHDSTEINVLKQHILVQTVQLQQKTNQLLQQESPPQNNDNDGYNNNKNKTKNMKSEEETHEEKLLKLKEERQESLLKLGNDLVGNLEVKYGKYYTGEVKEVWEAQMLDFVDFCKENYKDTVEDEELLKEKKQEMRDAWNEIFELISQNYEDEQAEIESGKNDDWDEAHKKTLCMRKLKLALNKMTPTKCDKISLDIMNLIGEYGTDGIQEMEHILGMILEQGVSQSIFSDQYAKLIQFIFDNLAEIYNNEIDFGKLVIEESHKLFEKCNNNKLEDKKSFISFLKFCGDLYNVNIMNSKIIYKGIIDTLLKNKNNIIAIDIEAICILFKECGNKLDDENTNCVNKYLKKITKLSKKFDFRTRFLVDEINEMRENDWTDRIEKEKPKHLDEIKKEFED